MRCPNCDKEVLPGWKTCPYCKYPLTAEEVAKGNTSKYAQVETMQCPNCQAVIQRGLEFCPFCKYPLTVEPAKPSTSGPGKPSVPVKRVIPVKVKRKSNIVVWVLIAIVFLIGIGTTIAVLIQKPFQLPVIVIPTTTSTIPGSSNGTPTLTLTPASGAPGSEFTVTGFGLTPNGTVKSADITFNGMPSTGQTYNIDSTGSVTFIITLPADEPPGIFNIKLTDSSGKSATTTFTVLAQSTQVNTTPTTAQVITTPSNSTGGSSLSNLVNKAANIPYYSCQVNMTSGGTTENMTEWVETGNPGKVRMEITVAGQTSDVIFDGQNYYMYMPSLNMAYEMSAASAQQYAANSASSITQYNPVSLAQRR